MITTAQFQDMQARCAVGRGEANPADAVPTLNEKPSRVEVQGSGLAELIDAVRGRGGIVETMTHACPGIYRLGIYWPPAEQAALPEILNGGRDD